MPDPNETEPEVQETPEDEAVETKEVADPLAGLTDRQREYVALADSDMAQNWSADQMVNEVSAGRRAATQMQEQNTSQEKEMWKDREKEKEAEPDGEPDDVITRAQAEKITDKRVNEAVSKRFDQLDKDSQHEACLAALGLEDAVLQGAARAFAQSMVDDGKCTLEQAYTLYGERIKSVRTAGATGATKAKIQRTAAMTSGGVGGSTGGTTGPPPTGPPADEGEDCFSPDYINKAKQEYVNAPGM